MIPPRETLAVLVVSILIGELSAATTKSWQHSQKMKDLESSRAVPLRMEKINDKLAFSENVHPTQSVQKVGGFENRAEPKKKVDNKLDKIHAKSFFDVEENLPRYDIGPGVNLTLDVGREIVNVNLDEDYLKDVFTGMIITPYEE